MSLLLCDLGDVARHFPVDRYNLGPGGDPAEPGDIARVEELIVNASELFALRVKINYDFTGIDLADIPTLVRNAVGAKTAYFDTKRSSNNQLASHGDGSGALNAEFDRVVFAGLQRSLPGLTPLPAQKVYTAPPGGSSSQQLQETVYCGGNIRFGTPIGTGCRGY